MLSQPVSRWRRDPILLILLVSFLMPVAQWLGMPRFYLILYNEILIWSIFAMGLDILVGYTGMISFGHAAFFGLGAYAAALISLHVTPVFWLGLVGGVAAAMAGGLLVGLISLRLKPVYFAMVTFAVSQLFFQLSVTVPWTKRWDGLVVRLPYDLGIPGIASVPIDSRLGSFWFTLTAAVLVYIGLQRMLNAPFGRTLVAIRENERRAEAIGIDTYKHRNLSLLISAGLAGLAGALYIPFSGFVSPQAFHVDRSGLILIIVLVGGAGTLRGSFLGSVLVILMSDLLNRYTKHWPLLLGVVLAIVVITAPRGLIGGLERLRFWQKRLFAAKRRAA